MEKHKYHSFFLPILLKLYPERANDEFIDITECLTGTYDQNSAICFNLIQSEYAIVEEYDRWLNMHTSEFTVKFRGKILPLGIEYIENYALEIKMLTKKRPQVGYKKD